MSAVVYLVGAAVLAVIGIVCAAAGRSLVELAERVDERMIAREQQRPGGAL